MANETITQWRAQNAISTPDGSVLLPAEESGAAGAVTVDELVQNMDGDRLDVDFTPSNYTPDATPAEADDVDDLAAHLKGIDAALGGSGGETLQQTYALGNTVAVTSGNGTVEITNDTVSDTTTALTVKREPSGSPTAGDAIEVTMGANATGYALDVEHQANLGIRLAEPSGGNDNSVDLNYYGMSGNGDGGDDLVVNCGTGTVAGAAGRNVNVDAGTSASGDVSNPSGAGGDITITGGASGSDGGAGRGVGGDITIRGGDGSTDGTITVGATNTSAIDSGSGSTPWTHDGPLYAQIEGVENANTSITAADSMIGQIIYCTASSAVTFTINSSLSTDHHFVVVQAGTGQVTIQASGNVALRYDDTTFNSKTAARHSMIFVHVKEADVDVYITGDLEVA